MCSSTVEVAEVDGSAKGPKGWFDFQQVRAVYDHPFHAGMETALILDFVSPEQGPGARVAVELSAESAERLQRVIESALAQGNHGH